MKRAGVLVDVDGTLVDSNYHHAIAWSRALRDHGRDARLAAIHRLVGMGGSTFLETLIGEDDEAIEDAWDAHFRELLPEVRAFDGAAELLRAMRDQGLTVVLATSSPKDLLEVLMAKVGADDAVDVAVTADDVGQAKPAPDVFQVALEKAGLTVDTALVLGDSVWDVESARRAALRCIGLETGGFSRAELEHAGALAVYEDVATLGRHLSTSPIARLTR